MSYNRPGVQALKSALRGIQIGLIPLLFLLSGCQSKILPKPEGSLADMQHWQLKARVSIRSVEDNVTATLDWQKQGQVFDFHLYGTFGVTYAHLIQKSEHAVLKLPDDQVFYHQDAQQLLYQSLGWDFPIDALAHWIKGLPAYRQGEIINRNPLGQIDQVLLNDWQVDFSRYEEFSGFSMPKIIKASHPQITLKIVVKDWHFLPPINYATDKRSPQAEQAAIQIEQGSETISAEKRGISSGLILR